MRKSAAARSSITITTTKYVYRKNLQGDIVAILDECGCTRGTYEYDAWGKIIWQGGSELLTINPFRYRGYYYDTETGLYYLNSRYYDPETGRFISPDGLKYLEPETCNGLNLYAYCGNNPVMFVDPTGHVIWSALLIAFAVGAAIGATTSAIAGSVAGKSGLNLLLHVLGGALLGGVLGTATALGGLFGIGAIGAKFAGIGLLGMTAASFGAGIACYGLQQVASVPGAEWNWGDAVSYGAISAVQGAFSFGVGALMGYTGNWTSLNKGQFTTSMRSAKQLSGSIVKGLFKYVSTYMKENISQIILRTFIKSIFVMPWKALYLRV